MALTITEIVRSATRNRRDIVADVTFDSSYPTGGEAFGPADLGLSTIDFIDTEHKGTEVVVFDRANSKLLIYTADGVEATNASNQSSFVTRVRALGY